MMRACKVRRILLLMVLAFSMMLSGVSYAGVEPAGSGKADVLIAFDRQPGSEEAALVRAFGGSVSHVYQIVPAIAATVPQAALYGLSHNPRILRIDPDLTVQALGEEIPWGIARIGATEARTAGASGATIKVAVLDTGIDFSHEDLTGHTSAGYDFVNEDGNPMDDDGHGTHVAGTIAATVGNDTGVVGVAPNVKLYALKVLDSNGSGSFSDIIEALQWCVTNGIDVTNNSYGSSGDPGPTVQEAFNNAYAADMLHVAAAGNSGKVRGTGDTVGYPAKYASVMAVAATDNGNVRAYFSSTGPDVEIAAPGVGILSTVPASLFNGVSYASWSGTSMATPHVTGVAALAMASWKAGAFDFHASDIRQQLTATADDLGTAGRDSWYGYGLVNAVKAVQVPEQPPSGVKKVSVTKIAYTTANGGKDLVVTFTVNDAQGMAVPNVRITAATVLTTATGTSSTSYDVVTVSTGTASYRWTNAPKGLYTTQVDGVTGTGTDAVEWDGITPDNGYAKKR